MSRLLSAFLILAFCILASGCGGSGSSGVSSPPPNPNAPATALRHFRNGDQWVYAVSGTATTSAGVKTFTGTDTIVANNVSLNGHPFLAMAETLVTQQSDGTALDSADTTYYTQLSNGDMVEDLDYNGNTGNLRGLTMPVVTEPGAWSSSLNYSTTLNYTNGPPDSLLIQVVGSRQDTVPAGAYWAWTTDIKLTNTLYTQTLTSDWAPDLGSYVQTSNVQTNANGDVYSFTETLQSTTVKL